MMSRSPSNTELHDSQPTPGTLAELVFYLPDAARRRQLEAFRIKYEALNGPTDLTKRYTSTWPQAHRDWLIQNDPKRYFDGLPPFAKAFLKGKMEIAARDGNLDDMPDAFLRLFVSGQMELDSTAL